MRCPVDCTTKRGKRKVLSARETLLTVVSQAADPLMCNREIFGGHFRSSGKGRSPLPPHSHHVTGCLFGPSGATSADLCGHKDEQRESRAVEVGGQTAPGEEKRYNGQE